MVLQAGSGSESAAGYYPVYGVELRAQGENTSERNVEAANLRQRLGPKIYFLQKHQGLLGELAIGTDLRLLVSHCQDIAVLIRRIKP